MELPIEIVGARDLKELIARAYLAQSDDAGQGDSPRRLGSVTLQDHQLSAVRRLGAAIDEFGGALLSDEVGMGKTFVALAMARRFTRCVVVGPAALRDMWAEQMRRAGVQFPFLSIESLSRKPAVIESSDLVIIDEAHHFRNPSTIRYNHVSQMVKRSKVLMLSATPIHNRRQDLVSVLALFLGSRAESLTGPEIARCVVRRQIESAGLSNRIPDLAALIWKEIDDDDVIPHELLALPPPVPPRDGGDGGALVARSLLRQWCSSDAALEVALRRRLARSMALADALQAGSYPSQRELSAWSFAEDSLQLAFPSLVASSATDSAAALLSTLHTHNEALRRILASIKNNHHRDAMRAQLIKLIRSEHPGVPVVAFSQYAETVRALFFELRAERGVSSLTASGARVAGGAISRREALARFAPTATGAKAPRDIDRIDLLLTTDLLSEGVNLQDAAVVIHLDLPWTAARLEQRVGRVRRMGSIHRRVHAYGIRPSTAAEALISLEETIRTKMRESQQSVGGSRPILPDENLPCCGNGNDHDPLTAIEQIRSVLGEWGTADHSLQLTGDRIRAAATTSTRAGFIALSTDTSGFALLVSDATDVSDNPTDILAALLEAGGQDVPPSRLAIATARERIRSWLRMTATLEPAEQRAAAPAHARRKVVRRISAAVENARPHARQRLLSLAERARVTVLGRLGAAAEFELLALASSPLPDEEWLRAIIHDAVPGEDHGRTVQVTSADQRRIVALLILDDSRLGNAVTRAKER